MKLESSKNYKLITHKILFRVSGFKKPEIETELNHQSQNRIYALKSVINLSLKKFCLSESDKC